MRPHRVKLNDQPAVYHCLTRTLHDRVLLGRREKDKACEFLDLYAEYWNADLLTYCVMGNHLQLLLRVHPPIQLSDRQLRKRIIRCYGEETMSSLSLRAELNRNDGQLTKRTRQSLHKRICDLSKMMTSLNQRLARWVRTSTGQTLDESKTFWTERFKSMLIPNQPAEILDVAAYIDTLPVRAGFVKNPAEYPWSGFGRGSAGNKIARRGLQAIGRNLTWKKVQSEYHQRISGKRKK